MQRLAKQARRAEPECRRVSGPPCLLALPLLAIAAACGGGAGEPGKPDGIEPRAATTALPSKESIVEKVYDPDYRVPDDFFVDERAGTGGSYTLHHVMDESASYELCTNDYSVAETWEAADNDSRQVSGHYVGAYENERYFEFIRELSYEDGVGNVDGPTSPGFARVFKCSNTVRDGVDRTLLTGYAGRLNARPLDAARLREFAEYLWQFTFFPERHRKVLASAPMAADGKLEHSLLLAFASGQGAGRCDRIELVRWTFAADQATGDIRSDFTELLAFEAELLSGSPRLCD